MRPISTFTVTPSVPESLSRLPELAYNIYWAWDHEAIALFQRLDPEMWEESNHNPVLMLGLISQEKFDQLAQDGGLLAHYVRVIERLDDYLGRVGTTWFPRTFGEAPSGAIAYFSFEFGLTESIRNYSGGLGILAGDHLKTASDLNLPLVGVGLLYQEGYFRQYLNADGWQQERYPENDFHNMPLSLKRGADNKPITISVDLAGRQTYAYIWEVKVGRILLYLLDTNITENPDPTDRDLTDQLYGGDREMRIRQEILLGIGGLRALHALGIKPLVCHMNEGHAAFMALERIRILMDEIKVSFHEAQAITAFTNIFTTHTPVPAGNDFFAPELVRKYFTAYWQTLGLDEKEFMSLGRFDQENLEEHFCMTILALRTSAYANGVSQLHGVVAREMWQDVYPGVPLHEVPIGAITNGVHTLSWISREIGQLFDRYLGVAWRDDPSNPEIWQRADSIPMEELWRVHEIRRHRLVAFARQRLVEQLENRGASPSQIESARDALDPDALTIGFARRFATYKRATLLLRDRDRLVRILKGDHPVQLIFAGKAHPHDNAGKEFIRQLVHFANEAGCRDRMIFLEDYDMIIGRYLTQGVDVWMNTPRRPMEASGTSGMKAVMNGIPNMSILDGWWAEAYSRQVGWAIGSGEEYNDSELQDKVESNAIYELIENDLMPAFYNRGSDDVPREWVAKMRACITDLAPVFSMARTVQDYTRYYYAPALEHGLFLQEENHAKGIAYSHWFRDLAAKWDALTIGEITVDGGENWQVGDMMRVNVQVKLGKIAPEDVAVQWYEGLVDRDSMITMGRAHTMQQAGPSQDGWQQFSLEVPCKTTGRHGYTVRVIPNHALVGDNTLRLGLIKWADGSDADVAL